MQEEGGVGLLLWRMAAKIHFRFHSPLASRMSLTRCTESSRWSRSHVRLARTKCGDEICRILTACTAKGVHIHMWRFSVRNNTMDKKSLRHVVWHWIYASNQTKNRSNLPQTNKTGGNFGLQLSLLPAQVNKVVVPYARSSYPLTNHKAVMCGRGKEVVPETE